MKNKLAKDVRERMEREIRQYDGNRKKLERLKKVGENTRKLLYLEERLEYVERAYNRLKPFEKQIYELIFKENCNWLYCQTMHQIDKNTYYATYHKALFYLAEEWGEV